MSVATQGFPANDLEAVEPYKILCSSAVASLVAGVLSLSAALDWMFGIVPVLGLLLGAVALWRISSNPQDLTGRKLALTGMALSTLFWATGAGWLTYVYLTEVPEGYQRISYAELQPVNSAVTDSIPAGAQRLDGKRVFIKGYAYPGRQQTEIKEFVLVRDNGTCCFGGPTPKLTDMIQVRLKDPLRLTYSTRLQKLAGTFRVEPAKASDELGGVLYHLDADYLQ